MRDGLPAVYKELKGYKASWYSLSNLLLLLKVSGCEALSVARVLDLMDSVKCSKFGADKVHDIQAGLSGLNVVKDGVVSVYSNSKGRLIAFGLEEVSIGVNEKVGSKVSTELNGGVEGD